VLDDIEFELYDWAPNGTDVVSVKYKGGWLITDNGYHRWPITIPPLKATTSRKEIRFSEWLESMRKDVECTFGILKGRWRILKAGIRIHGITTADKIWKTCCALHNWLLHIDGLDKEWNSVWQGDMGEYARTDMPEAIRRLVNPSETRHYDTSGRGVGQDCDLTGNDDGLDDLGGVDNPQPDEDGRICIRDLTMKEFRNRLITHFDIAFKRREIEWPSRNGGTEPNI
jgi:hypothetical protein